MSHAPLDADNEGAPTAGEPSWLDSYYDALEFFYWEPQHLGRKKHADSRYDSIEKVRDHLHRIEPTLNYNFEQFLLLAPSSVRNDLFERLFAHRFEAPFTMYSRRATGLDLAHTVQPDLLFVSDAEVVCLEMKIGAKSDIPQVLKYALLGLALELQLGSPKQHYLGFLGVGEFSRQFAERYPSTGELRAAITTDAMSSFFAKRPQRFGDSQGRFEEIVAELGLAYINYPQLADFLRQIAPAETDNSAGAEVYRKLIDGLLGELHERRLAE